MNAKQKKFILTKLIPFIMRENGRGFEMETWKFRILDGETKYFHSNTNKTISAPKCGTVCCIGGSIQILKRLDSDMGFNSAGELIGLSSSQSHKLFSASIVWPEPFASRYKKAKTPLTQAKIACEVLKEVVRTEGACLDK